MTERELYAPLLLKVQQLRRLRSDTLVAQEVSTNGRHVDLALLNRSGNSTAFEFKLRSPRRVLTQALLNAVLFDRSYIVIASPPRANLLDSASRNGIGIFSVSSDGADARLVLEARRQIIAPQVRELIRTKLEISGTRWSDVSDI